MKRLGNRELVRSELLSFHFAAEEEHDECAARSSRKVRGGGGPRQGPRSGACLANHRFLIHPRSTWVAGAVPQWEGIAAVEVAHDELTRLFPHCAICMDFADPQLARITRCGHIYCLLCLLRHLSYEGAANCPVCQEVLLERDLRRVLFHSFSQVPKEGREFSFRLVAVSKRGAVWPADHPTSQRGMPTPETSDYARLSRCVAATAEAIGRRIESEEAYLLQLQTQFEEGSDQDRYEAEYLPFISSALLSIRDELEKNSSNATVVQPKEEFNEQEAEAMPLLYQADTGDLVFLHPMNRKCLLALSAAAPSAFSSKVLEVDRIVLCAEQKKKLGFLRHLPLNADVFLVEVELSSVVTDAAAIEPFLSDIQKREKARVERSNKLRKEKRADEEKVRLEKKKWVERQEMLTQCCKELFSGPVVGSTSSSSDIALPPSSAEDVSAAEEQEGVSAFSFASIAREGGNFPTLGLGTPKPPLPPQSSVWGAAKAPIAQQTAESAAPQKGKLKFKKGEALALFSNSSARSYK